MTKCDVIVPIYNAYDCVVELVESLLKYTNLDENRIILINDKSPDKRISELLEEYKKKYPKFIILENEVNKGFVGTVNVGMKQSKKNDVLLLNSDTIVTKNWLDNIKKCAYSSKKIATVTPLSNNATMASVPVPFKRNELPEGISIDEMAKIVEENSFLDYPDLPTGHGFCLYIKREVLDKIGYFDEETFGKGYGEENDFCFRCLDIGYRNVLCDNVYIYHKESQSFSESKLALMEENGKKLENRYPEYYKELHKWCLELPIRYIGNNIGFALKNKNEKKKNILILIHDWHDVEHHLGGTTLHVYDIINKLRDKYNFHVLAPNNYIYYLTSYWTNSESTIAYSGIFDSRKYGFYNNEYKKMLDSIVKEFAIDAVHIHHMKNHYFDILDVINENKLYSIVSLHDFYSVCPLINKMYNNERYCGNPTEEKCNKCLLKTVNIRSNMISEWRKQWSNLFSVCDKIIAPSNACKEEVLMTYKKLNIDIIEHGVDLEKSDSKKIRTENRELNVAFLGALGIIKGSDIVFDLLKKKYKGINFHLFGVFDRILSKSQNKRIKIHGKYKRENLPKLLKNNKIDLICLISICPETYSYTLTEAASCGIPVLVSNLGALKERVENDNLGWVIDLDCDNPSKKLIDKIYEIKNNSDEYNQKVNSIEKYKIKTVDEMVNDYNKIYKNIKSKNKVISYDEIKNQIHNSNKYISVVNNADYSWVFETFKWKLISKLKLPKGIKKIIRRNNDD